MKSGGTHAVVRFSPRRTARFQLDFVVERRAWVGARRHKLDHSYQHAAALDLRFELEVEPYREGRDHVRKRALQHRLLMAAAPRARAEKTPTGRSRVVRV